jgi:hypothetical protein
MASRRNECFGAVETRGQIGGFIGWSVFFKGGKVAIFFFFDVLV